MFPAALHVMLYGPWPITACRLPCGALASRRAQSLLCITQPCVVPHQDADTLLRPFSGRWGAWQ